MSVLARPFQWLAAWLGGWSRVALLVIVVIGIGVGLWWQQQRQPPIPPNVTGMTESIVGDVRQTTFRYNGSIDQVRAFYQEAMPGRGWRYCGTQATTGCSNIISLIDRSPDAIDVYRRADDQANAGSTIEVWPIESENNQTFVTLYETRGQ